MGKGKTGRKAIAAYTALFAVWFAACYGVLLQYGRTPIWAFDGLMQHYTFMMYVGQWLRNAAGALFSGGAVPMFDFSLGMGEDVLAAVNYYGLGDPTMLLSALFAGPSTELCYGLILALRGWCAGAACIALARNRRLSWRASVAAGVVYAFSLTLFDTGMTRNAMFANPYYQFPLMLLGLEHVFEKKKPWLLSLATALSAVCGFYFLYSNSLLMLIYALVRHFTMGREKPLRALPGVAGRALGWYGLGLGLSAAIFLPVTLGFLMGAQRSSGYVSLGGIDWLYPLNTYLMFPRAALTSHATSGVPFMPALVMLASMLMLVRHRREDRSWIALMLVGLLMLLTPATGYALNGFSYATNRWGYALYLLLALVFAKMLPELARLTKCERILPVLLAAAAVGYTALIWLRGVHSTELLLMTALLIAVCAVVLILSLRPRLLRPAAVLLAGMLLVNMASAHYITGRDKHEELVPFGEAYAQVMADSYENLPSGDGLQRIDADVATANLFNASVMTGRPSTSVYNSLISGSCYSFMQEVANAGIVQSNAINGVDGRAALEALWSVDRFVCDAGTDARIPYGFEFSGEADGLSVYENTLALPLGYALTGTMSADDYAALSPLDKQWALLQCAVTDGTSVPTAEPALSSRELEISDVQMENIAVEEDRMIVGEDARILLSFDAPADCELYLQLDGLAFLNAPQDLQNLLLFESGDVRTSVLLMRDGVAQDIARPFYLVNLGYDAQARATAEIRFARTGEYRLSGMKLYAQPMADFPAMVKALQNRSLQDVQVNANRISGAIALDEPAVLTFSIPYSQGWTIAVDGEPVTAQASANAFLACELPAGEHAVLLTYETPWLRVGCAITLLSLIALPVAAVLGRKKTLSQKE